MLRRDLTLYRTLLQQIPLGELVCLYEQNVSEYPVLAEAVAERLNYLLSLQDSETWKMTANHFEAIDCTGV